MTTTRTWLWLIAGWLVVLFMVSCKTSQPVVSIMPPPVPATVATTEAVLPPPPAYYSLAWQLAGQTTNLVVEIWSTTNLAKAFVEIGISQSNSWPLMATNPCAFFKVRASNTLNGMVSGWASK